jgi:hypothetical protein
MKVESIEESLVLTQLIQMMNLYQNGIVQSIQVMMFMHMHNITILDIQKM